MSNQDIASTLLISQHRAKLAGKAPPSYDTSGTGSVSYTSSIMGTHIRMRTHLTRAPRSQCFDATTLSPTRAGGHSKLAVAEEELPVWSKSTMSYK